jgi:hypothetical protein
MKIIDVEIKKGILGKGETPMPGIQYCGGWRDFPNMGCSVVCVFDLSTRLTRVFLEEDFEELRQFVSSGPTGGFNTRGFDLPLLAHHGIRVDESQHFDALWKIWQAQGLDPSAFNWRTHGGWSLDNIMQSTFGLAKSGHGAMAPVWLEGKLIEHLLAGGQVFKEPVPGVRVA